MWHFLASIAWKDFIPEAADKYTSNPFIFLRKVNVLNVERRLTVTLQWESTRLRLINSLKKKVYTVNCRLLSRQIVMWSLSKWNFKDSRFVLFWFSHQWQLQLQDCNIRHRRQFNQFKTCFEHKFLLFIIVWALLTEQTSIVARFTLYYPTRISSPPQASSQIKIRGWSSQLHPLFIEYLHNHTFQVVPKYEFRMCSIKNSEWILSTVTDATLI